MEAEYLARRWPNHKQAMATVARSLLSVVLMLVVFYRAPLTHQISVWTIVWFATGLLALAGALAWQVRSILRSATPRLLATSAVAVGLPFLLLLYAAVYAVMSANNPAHFSEPLGHTAALYLTMTVFSTIGFGDITPVTEAARIVVMTQMVVGLLAVGVVAKILFGAAQMARDRQAEGTVVGRPVQPAAPRADTAG